ncbi:MAG: superoxide dismutase family protein [Tistlia sp.]|uniref:superoxide dismutase family protein n=1 Tax=Tistlia sp. TaxID=3057121 RepID=UPI0034A2981D
MRLLTPRPATARSALPRPAAGLVLAGLLAGTAGAAFAQEQASHPAGAILIDQQGERVGSAALIETPSGLLIQLDVEGLPAGVHGFHIHETGACETPDFKSAGGHFNPDGRTHGFLSEEGPHQGDLPNIYADEGVPTRADAFAPGVSLEGDGGLLDDDGAALVIHATADDYQTDPAGHAGERLACGVVERQEARQ